ncbi:bifunctional D-glycero-beta-D-manno-heptose-7-phosphate kinase/D-glycero-beta-D-manno-heptose 1-phosphate adenylyltransferase HldE, partial [Escherichia coli]|nr:bifunctional D-glycero-beta-D-manno-heptose-7-phosphate kinase/D-glycero-beta-D-manno-heptose 1-phosphate adenylyltransferase HldE [Escherichia coli]
GGNGALVMGFLGGNGGLVGLAGFGVGGGAWVKPLADVNVKGDFVPVPTHPTITKLRVLSRNQQLIRLDFEEGFEGVDPQPLHERINQALSSIGALVLSDYAKGALASVQQMIQLARKAGVPVLIDPKGTDFERYRGATLLTPNLSEFEAVVGKCKTEEEIVERGMKLIADYELSALLVTRSEQGMSLLQPGKAPLHMPTQAQEVYDVTGAGDTVIGVLAATLAAGNSLEEACFFANAAAGVVVGKLGTSTVSPIELENAVRGRADTGFGVMTEEELKLAVAAARKRGEKVVMTNGVFDILHAGHVSYLANARKLGDRLIVAVNSDASTKRLKGDSRPVNPLEQRMIVLGALEAVDWVVSFEEDTPQRLIAGILPDLLVKGGDYKPEEIAGSKEVWANGGEVLVLNFEDGCSTTNIIKKIQQDKKG